jgi:hypothetical protein
MESFRLSLTDLLTPIAAWFKTLSMPESIVHWGHPLMMGIVLFVMGSYVAWTGWKARFKTEQTEESQQLRAKHRQVAPLMFTFIAMGYTGGVLSLVMQEQSILESSHFWTGTAVIGLLLINGLLAAIKFGNSGGLRSVHAYVGSLAVILFVVHAALGLKLGLSS